MCSHIPVSSLKSSLIEESIQECSFRDIFKLRNKASDVFVDIDVGVYSREICSRLRHIPGFVSGITSRTFPVLETALRITAVLDDSPFVSPTHVVSAVFPVLRHRILLDSEETESVDSFIKEVILESEPPA